jgi:hypothetical protein
MVDNAAWRQFGTFSTSPGANGGVFVQWTPVPEPGGVLLVAAGAFLGRRVIRRRRGLRP